MWSCRRLLYLWVFGIAWIRLSPLVYGGASGDGTNIGAGGRGGNNNRYERGTGGDAAAEAEARDHHLIYGSPREDLEYVNHHDQLYDERARQQVEEHQRMQYQQQPPSHHHCQSIGWSPGEYYPPPPGNPPHTPPSFQGLGDQRQQPDGERGGRQWHPEQHPSPPLQDSAWVSSTSGAQWVESRRKPFPEATIPNGFSPPFVNNDAHAVDANQNVELPKDKIDQNMLQNMDKERIFEALKKMYRKKILPIEEASKFSYFQSPSLNPADFEAKPMVLVVGQYSVGKTSFISSLLRKQFPGQRVGPEPTTDRFMAISYGKRERVMPGHALAMQADQPFKSLQQFGNAFLTKFEGSVVNSPLLRNITIIDTPGILSGEKQRIGRDYDFSAVISWFAERADLIIVMFDAHKLDISDELKTVIDQLKPHSDKMRVLLNKADTIDTQQLMRVYGALMWSLGKVMQTPEVCRVYIGSFWGAPLQIVENRLLLEREKEDLLDELRGLPNNAVIRRINELVKRARSVKVHSYIIHYLRKQMPYTWGKQEKQQKLLSNLHVEFLGCARRYGLPLGDFPKVDSYRRKLAEIKDISKFHKLDKSAVAEMDKLFSHEIPRLIQTAQTAPR